MMFPDIAPPPAIVQYIEIEELTIEDIINNRIFKNTDKGFLTNDSRHVKNISYGLFKSDYNGCGWIAVYNVLRFLEYNPNAYTVSKEMEKHTVLLGLFGTDLNGIVEYLQEQGLTANTTKTEYEKYADKSEVCILYYSVGLRTHYVMISKIDGVGYRYINGNAPAQPIADFLEYKKATDSTLIYITR